MSESPYERGEGKKAKQNNNQAIKDITSCGLHGHRRKPLENEWRAHTTSHFEVNLSKHYYKTIISVWE